MKQIDQRYNRLGVEGLSANLELTGTKQEYKITDAGIIEQVFILRWPNPYFPIQCKPVGVKVIYDIVVINVRYIPATKSRHNNPVADYRC